MDPILDFILKYLVVPLGAFVWGLHVRVQKQATDLAVMKAENTARREAADREREEMRGNLKAIFAKLDSIETALRK